jgi:hypothetical protein
VRDNRLLVLPECRQRLLPQGNGWHRRTDICGRDDRVHAQQCASRSSIDRPDRAVRDRATQDDGPQQSGPGDIVDVFSTAAQKTEIFNAFDRAPNIRVRRPNLLH